MDALTLFGLFAVTAMLVTYALEDRSHWFVLLFAASCALGSAYGFLQGLAVRPGRGDLVHRGAATMAAEGDRKKRMRTVADKCSDHLWQMSHGRRRRPWHDVASSAAHVD